MADIKNMEGLGNAVLSQNNERGGGGACYMEGLQEAEGFRLGHSLSTELGHCLIKCLHLIPAVGLFICCSKSRKKTLSQQELVLNYNELPVRSNI